MAGPSLLVRILREIADDMEGWEEKEEEDGDGAAKWG